MELTRRVKKAINALFSANEAQRALYELEQNCSVRISSFKGWTQAQMEKVWLSVIKLSNGNLAKLKTAIELANTDYRDLFMSAGFGHDIEAHKKWKP